MPRMSGGQILAKQSPRTGRRVSNERNVDGVNAATVTPSGRLRGVGTLARVGTVTPTIFLVPAFLATFRSINEMGPAPTLLAGFLVVPVALAAVRSPFIGLWLKPDELMARTWWRTIRIPRRDLSSCITFAYWGAFTEGWSVQYLRELEIGTATGGTYTLGGSIAWHSKSARQRREVLRYIESK